MSARPRPRDRDELLALLPADRPYAAAEVRDAGVTARQIATLVGLGRVRRPVRGVYTAATLPDTLETRLQVLRLVVPAGCVVTDRTAGWLWAGNRMLAPGDHLVTPPLSVFCPPGHRLRSDLTDSGERRFLPHDLVEVGGLCVTTPLRTACDLGRLLHRDQALAALDTLAATGHFSLDQLAAETTRFRGYRGVVQLRALVLIVDPRSQSPYESILRIRWLDAGLPAPQCQVEVPKPGGSSYWLDIGLPDALLAAEYDGEEFHGDDAADHDEARRAWLREERGWTIVVARNHNVVGHRQDIHATLVTAWLGVVVGNVVVVVGPGWRISRRR